MLRYNYDKCIIVTDFSQHINMNAKIIKILPSLPGSPLSPVLPGWPEGPIGPVKEVTPIILNEH